MKDRPNSKQFTVTGKPKDDIEKLYRTKHAADSNYSYTDLIRDLMEHYPQPEDQIHENFKKIISIFKQVEATPEEIITVNQFEALLIYLLDDDFRDYVRIEIDKITRNKPGAHK